MRLATLFTRAWPVAGRCSGPIWNVPAGGAVIRIPHAPPAYTTPKASMARATFMKPAMLAPST